MSDGNIDTVRRFYSAGPSDDDSERHRYASPEIVWHVPGSNHISGVYQGIEAVFEDVPARMQPLDEWVVAVTDVMANTDLVVATLTLTARRGSIRVDCRGAHVFRLGLDGLIVEAWGFVEDQAELDRLFDSGI